MVTAVGFNSPASCAAMRAGISGIVKGNIWDPEVGDFIGVGRPYTPQWWEGPDMLAELAAPAVQECLKELPKGIDSKSVPIFVLLCSKDRPFRKPDLENNLLFELEHRLQHNLATDSNVYSVGRTGILPALHAASNLISNNKASYVVIVGVDTFIRQPLVETYIKQRRVLTEGNSNGFIPGEAACAVLLAQSGRNNGGELRIIGWGMGLEKGTIDSDIPLTGNGLTQALREALTRAGIVMADADYWLTDQNAEHYKAKECTIAQIRLERRDGPAPQPFEIWHPIEFLGEIGSAIAPCLLGVGFTAAKKGYAPGPLALMHVGEDNGERVALVLQWAMSK